MTPEDLAAIRADLSVRFDPIATALLAEVDRLTVELSMSPMADDLAVWADRKRILARVDGMRMGRGDRSDNDFQRGYRQGWNDAIAVAHHAIDGGEE